MIQDLFDSLLNAQWLQDFLSFVVAVIMVLVQIVLIPISFLIELFFPDIDNMLSSIPLIFDNAGTYLAWTFSAFAVPPLIISGIILYYGYVLVAPIAIWGIKLSISWYKAIKG